jgi:hypothetical protein
MGTRRSVMAAMTAKERIEKLTNSWYGFAVFTGLVSILINGVGVFSLIGAALSTLISLVVAFFLGRRLLAKSRFWRMVLIILAGFGTLIGTFAVGKLTYTFFHEWSFGLLFHAALGAVTVYMDIRSLRVLMDKSVKAYFA